MISYANVESIHSLVLPLKRKSQNDRPQLDRAETFLYVIDWQIS
jgi:hypothetical protein